MLDLIRGIGIPAKWMTIPVETKLVLGVVSLIAQPLPGLPGRAGMSIFGKSPLIRQMLFVDGDVDSQDFVTSVMLDKNFKVHPWRNIHMGETANKPLGLTEAHDFSTGFTSTAIIDATWRLDRPPETLPRRVNFEVCFPKEVQEKVIRTWNEELKITPRAWRYKG
jgi:hypothetical protein